MRDRPKFEGVDDAALSKPFRIRLPRASEASVWPDVLVDKRHSAADTVLVCDYLAPRPCWQPLARTRARMVVALDMLAELTRLRSLPVAAVIEPSAKLLCPDALMRSIAHA